MTRKFIKEQELIVDTFKIRSDPNIVLEKLKYCLSLALELNIEQTDELLSAAGYTLSDSDIFDLVIQFCIERK